MKPVISISRSSVMTDKTKTKAAVVLGVVLLFVLLLVLPTYFSVTNPPKEVPSIDTFYVRRDSIVKQIDTLVIERTKYQIQYEKQIETVDTQSVSADMQFFTEYLLQRFPSNNNDDSTKTGE